MYFEIVEASRPFRDVVEREVEGVEDGPSNGRNVGMCASQPRLNVRNRSRSAHGEVSRLQRATNSRSS
jgi:hypothetical protein